VITLQKFQHDFMRALLDPGCSPSQAPTVAALIAQPAFNVYRNTVIKSCIDALQANFPAVSRLVGDEWFRAAAAVYARDHPPDSAELARYGASFPEFLASFEPAQELPYLPSVAALDRLWTESHLAADAPVLAAAMLAATPPSSLYRTCLEVHPAARWRWSGELPAYSIWSSNRENRDVGNALVWQGEGALLTRPGGNVQWDTANHATCSFLDFCAAGENIATATEQALSIDSRLDLLAMIASLLLAGAFTNLRLPEK